MSPTRWKKWRRGRGARQLCCLAGPSRKRKVAPGLQREKDTLVVLMGFVNGVEKKIYKNKVWSAKVGMRVDGTPFMDSCMPHKCAFDGYLSILYYCFFAEMSLWRTPVIVMKLGYEGNTIIFTCSSNKRKQAAVKGAMG